MLSTLVAAGCLANAAKQQKKDCFVKKRMNANDGTGHEQNTVLSWFGGLASSAYAENVLSNDDRLSRLIGKGLQARGLLDDDTYRQRVEIELNVLRETGFDDLLMIVYDLCAGTGDKDAGEHSLMGTIETSLVAYLLGLVSNDPVKAKLPFGFRKGS